MLTLIETKLHLRVDTADEDTLITALMETARLSVGQYLNMPVEQLTTTVPSPIKSAALLMVADLYENREGQSDRQLYRNTTYERLLSPYRVMA